MIVLARPSLIAAPALSRVPDARPARCRLRTIPLYLPRPCSPRCRLPYTHARALGKPPARTDRHPRPHARPLYPYHRDPYPVRHQRGDVGYARDESGGLYKGALVHRALNVVVVLIGVLLVLFDGGCWRALVLWLCLSASTSLVLRFRVRFSVGTWYLCPIVCDRRKCN